jgi:hypothetical protein
MLVVVASPWDEAAHALVERWEPHGAGLLTVNDLSTAGWRQYLEDPDRSRAVIDGRVVATSDISGVLTRLPAVTEQELPAIVSEDRDYAAVEMTAFLTYWLSTLECPVLNQPSASCLCGPSWRPEQWALAASRLGLPVAPRRRYTPPFGKGATADIDDLPFSFADAHAEAVQMTVIGDRCIGSGDEDLARQARLLATAAGVDLLAVVFSGPEVGSQFVDAHLWVDVWDNAVSESIFGYFSSPAQRTSLQRGMS